MIPERAGSLVRVALTGLDEAEKDESGNRLWAMGREIELPAIDGFGRDVSEYTENDLTGFLDASG